MLLSGNSFCYPQNGCIVVPILNVFREAALTITKSYRNNFILQDKKAEKEHDAPGKSAHHSKDKPHTDKPHTDKPHADKQQSPHSPL